MLRNFSSDTKKSLICASLKIFIPIADFKTYSRNNRIAKKKKTKSIPKSMLKSISLIDMRMSKIFFSKFIMI